MNPLTLAYLAGQIDADGHITIIRAVKKEKRNRCGPTTYYAPKLGLGQIQPTIPELLRETFGGGRVGVVPPKSDRHEPYYRWQADCQKAAAALRLLLPHLILKKKQAELAIALAELIDRQWAVIKATTKPPYRVPKAMNAERQKLWEACVRLNRAKNRRVHFPDDQSTESGV